MTTLFPALEIATGKVTDACYARHRHEEFLKKVVGAYPRVRTSRPATTPRISTPISRRGWR
jgi:hypothetical protein